MWVVFAILYLYSTIPKRKQRGEEEEESELINVGGEGGAGTAGTLRANTITNWEGSSNIGITLSPIGEDHQIMDWRIHRKY